MNKFSLISPNHLCTCFSIWKAPGLVSVEGEHLHFWQMGSFDVWLQTLPITLCSSLLLSPPSPSFSSSLHSAFPGLVSLAMKWSMHVLLCLISPLEKQYSWPLQHKKDLFYRSRLPPSSFSCLLSWLIQVVKEVFGHWCLILQISQISGIKIILMEMISSIFNVCADTFTNYMWWTSSLVYACLMQQSAYHVLPTNGSRFWTGPRLG